MEKITIKSERDLQLFQSLYQGIPRSLSWDAAEGTGVKLKGLHARDLRNFHELVKLHDTPFPFQMEIEYSQEWHTAILPELHHHESKEILDVHTPVISVWAKALDKYMSRLASVGGEICLIFLPPKEPLNNIMELLQACHLTKSITHTFVGQSGIMVVAAETKDYTGFPVNAWIPLGDGKSEPGLLFRITGFIDYKSRSHKSNEILLMQKAFRKWKAHKFQGKLAQYLPKQYRAFFVKG